MLKELDSYVCYVDDVAHTADFYANLGFNITKRTGGMAIAQLGDFEIHFHDPNEEDQPEFRKKAHDKPRGNGLYTYILVSGIDNYFDDLKGKGVIPLSEPKNQPWGNREFLVQDPDGYNIVFYEPIS